MNVTIDLAGVLTALAALIPVVVTAWLTIRHAKNQIMDRIDSHAADIRGDIAAQTDPSAKTVQDFINTVGPPDAPR